MTILIMVAYFNHQNTTGIISEQKHPHYQFHKQKELENIILYIQICAQQLM